MARLPVVTVPFEGGPYQPGRGPGAPIRIYADRWVEDDIVFAAVGRQRRERLTRRRFRDVKRQAKANRASGMVRNA